MLCNQQKRRYAEAHQGYNNEKNSESIKEYRDILKTVVAGDKNGEKKIKTSDP